MAEKDFRVQKGLIVNDGDITVPSAHSVFAGTFDTNVAAAGVTLTAITLAADGTNNNIDINITPKGTGEVNITKVDIDAGTIDGATIATSNITVGTGKTLDVSAGTLTLADGQISADAISGDLGIALDDLSVSTASASGGGALAYNNTSGAFTYTPPLNITGNAGNAAKVTVTDSTASTAFPVVFHNEGSAGTLLDDTGAFTYNPSTGQLTQTGAASGAIGLVLKNTAAPGAGSNVSGQTLIFKTRRNGSEAGKNNDDLGLIHWYGNDSDGNNQSFGYMKVRAVDVTSGAEKGSMQFGVATSGNSGGIENVLTITGGAAALSSTVVIAGNLQVDGTTTTINSTTIELDDKNIELAKGIGNDAAVTGGGITLISSEGNKTFNWVTTRAAWTSSENLELASGKKLIINANDVLTQTTLGSTVLNSSLTSVGTIATGVWNGTAISNAKIAPNLTINGGTIDNSVIGGSTPAAGTFTNLTSNNLSVDSVAVLDSSSVNSQSFNCQAGNGVAKTLASYSYNTYRTAKFIGHIVNNSTHETDCFEVLVTYDGSTGPAATSDVHMTTYAYISSNDTPMGTLAAVKSGTSVALQFTNTVADFAGAFSVVATQLIRQ